MQRKGTCGPDPEHSPLPRCWAARRPAEGALLRGSKSSAGPALRARASSRGSRAFTGPPRTEAGGGKTRRSGNSDRCGRCDGVGTSLRHRSYMAVLRTISSTRRVNDAHWTEVTIRHGAIRVSQSSLTHVCATVFLRNVVLALWFRR